MWSIGYITKYWQACSFIEKSFSQEILGYRLTVAQEL